MKLSDNAAMIKARDLNEAYYMLLSECYKNGIYYRISNGSYKGAARIELSFASGIIDYPNTRPLSPIMPDGVPATTNDEKIESYFLNYLLDPELEENEEYRYSTWINGNYYNHASGRKESQLEWCIDHFKTCGFENNHCYITIGHPQINFNYDIPYKNETERRTSPCLRGIDLKVKEGYLILGVVYRSWDLFAGFPENMGGFALLNEYISDLLGVKTGPLTFASQGLHCYDFQLESVKNYLRF